MVDYNAYKPVKIRNNSSVCVYGTVHKAYLAPDELKIYKLQTHKLIWHEFPASGTRDYM